MRSPLLAALVAGLTWMAQGAQAPPSEVRVVLETSLGNIEVAIDTIHAPVSSANFLWYVDHGQYDGGLFHRTVTMQNQETSPVKIEVIQAGVNPAHRRDGQPPIALERTSVTGLHHLDGTISMARSGPDTATSDFFLCIGDQPALDFGGARNPDGQGFAAFGQVTSGMDVARAIQKSPAQAQNLMPPIPITKAYRRP